jgi:hypothetical protein
MYRPDSNNSQYLERHNDGKLAHCHRCITTLSLDLANSI